jgi:hypothetical protein
MPTGQALMRMVMAQVISRPANQSAAILVRSTWSRTAPIALRSRPTTNREKLCCGAHQRAARGHQSQASEHDAPIAEPLAEESAGQRQDRARQREEPDEPAELGVGDVETLHEERRNGADRLELEAHRRAGNRQHREREPATLWRIP